MDSKWFQYKKARGCEFFLFDPTALSANTSKATVRCRCSTVGFVSPQVMLAAGRIPLQLQSSVRLSRGQIGYRKILSIIGQVREAQAEQRTRRSPQQHCFGNPRRPSSQRWMHYCYCRNAARINGKQTSKYTPRKLLYHKAEDKTITIQKTEKFFPLKSDKKLTRLKLIA